VNVTQAHQPGLLAFASLGLMLASSQAVHASDPIAYGTAGAQTYSKYCALCHGDSGKGDGRAASLQKKRPADLTASVATYEDKLEIVRKGGAAVKRSVSMPAWSEVLTAQEIKDVVAFLESMSSRTPNASSTACSSASSNRSTAPQ
jgi:mono/diheme cytochrome c family protein